MSTGWGMSRGRFPIYLYNNNSLRVAHEQESTYVMAFFNSKTLQISLNGMVAPQLQIIGTIEVYLLIISHHLPNRTIGTGYKYLSMLFIKVSVLLPPFIFIRNKNEIFFVPFYIKF
jgi:hypothetical protein